MEAMQARQDAQRRYLNTSEAAAYLGVSPTTLANWRHTKLVQVPYSKIGNRVVYDILDLDAYVTANKVVS